MVTGGGEWKGIHRNWMSRAIISIKCVYDKVLSFDHI